MTKTARIEELLQAMRDNGYWTAEEMAEIEEIIMPPFKFEIEGDFPEQGGAPRAYDRPMHTHELPTSDDMVRDLKLDTPPPRPGEPAELKDKLVTYPPPIVDEERLKTLEATMTDVMRRLKALEERVIDPSV